MQGPVTQSMLPNEPSSVNVRPVTVTVLASAAGDIRNLAVNQTIVPNLQGLRDQLQRTSDGSAPCSLTLQVDAKLHYQQLVHVVDACMEGGVSESAIEKMTFVELRQSADSFARAFMSRLRSMIGGRSLMCLAAPLLVVGTLFWQGQLSPRPLPIPMPAFLLRQTAPRLAFRPMNGQPLVWILKRSPTARFTVAA